MPWVIMGMRGSFSGSDGLSECRAAVNKTTFLLKAASQEHALRFFGFDGAVTTTPRVTTSFHQYCRRVTCAHASPVLYALGTDSRTIRIRLPKTKGMEDRTRYEY